MKLALFRPSLFLLLSMCMYFVRSAPIVGDKTVDLVTSQEHSLKQEETSESSRNETVIQGTNNNEDILKEDTNNEAILNDETNNNEDILNEETSNSEDIETNNRKETNDNDTILNGDESVTVNPIPEKASEDVKASFENKTISDNENYETLESKDNERGQRNEYLSTEVHTLEQSNEIQNEDFFFHMLNYIISGEEIKKETDETKHSKMEEDKEGNEEINVINSKVTDEIKHSKMEEDKQNEDINVVQIKNTTGELIDELITELGGQQEDSNIKIEDNEKDQLLTENGTDSEKDDEIATMRENIVKLKKEIESIEEEIESVRKDIKSTVKVSGGGEENGKTNDTDSSIMDQIWNYFG